MSVREKAGQLFCLLGDTYDSRRLESLVRDGIGGVLFRPVRTKKEICADFERLDSISSVPLLHAANLEEGGAGIASDGTCFASQLQIAASCDCINDMKSFALNCLKEGVECGVNWTFSPVSDIDYNFLNPITNCRTLGSDKNLVAKLAEIYVSEVQRGGIAACAKHFPGDGVDYRDHHLHPTYNTLSADEWRSSYGMVYRTLIEAGLLSVMAGHICQPALEKEYAGCSFEECLPASLSKPLLTDVLRGELGFNGLITTDASIMGGFCMAMERKKAIPQAIVSGCDMIVFSPDIEEDLEYMIAGIEEGIIPPGRLNDALTRILALKQVVSHDKRTDFGSDGNGSGKERCARNSVTLVKDEGIIPVTHFKTIRLTGLGSDDTWDGSLREMLKNEFEKRGFGVEIYNPYEDDLHGIRNLSAERLTVIYAYYPPASNRTTVRINWCDKHALEIPRYVNEEKSVFVSFANPYHLQDIPRVKTYINAYTATKATVQAVVEKLCGESGFCGKSPVDPFCKSGDTRI